jgi:formamidopyrimidine-DNA glycosylase
LPELPEVELVRRQLEPVLKGARFEHVLLRRRDLRTPFPREFSRRLAGQTVVALTRRAKYLLAELSSGDALLMHLGMSGDFRVESGAVGDKPPAFVPGPHDHVIFYMTSGALVIFNDPRRFGVMDLLPPARLATFPALERLGPEPLSDGFDASVLARAVRGKKTSLKAALLDQRIVAGLGNIYASEALHRAGLSPLRRASTLATPSGAPRSPAHRLVAAIKAVLSDAIARSTRTGYRASRFRVYDREGERCLRRGCPGTVRRRTQAGRSTFYCPTCQR